VTSRRAAFPPRKQATADALTLKTLNARKRFSRAQTWIFTRDILGVSTVKGAYGFSGAFVVGTISGASKESAYNIEV
jgi:hypothetical protein